MVRLGARSATPVGARRSAACFERARMLGLVEGEFAGAGESERGHQAEAFLGDLAGELDTLGRQVRDGRTNVVAHEVELMMRLLVGGVRCELGRGQRENEPATPGIDRFELQHVVQKPAHPRRIVGEDDRVDTDDHVNARLPSLCRPAIEQRAVG
jgi:hypothetical protein